MDSQLHRGHLHHGRPRQYCTWKLNEPPEATGGRLSRADRIECLVACGKKWLACLNDSVGLQGSETHVEDQWRAACPAGRGTRWVGRFSCWVRLCEAQSCQEVLEILGLQVHWPNHSFKYLISYLIHTWFHTNTEFHNSDLSHKICTIKSLLCSCLQ